MEYDISRGTEWVQSNEREAAGHMRVPHDRESHAVLIVTCCPARFPCGGAYRHRTGRLQPRHRQTRDAAGDRLSVRIREEVAGDAIRACPIADDHMTQRGHDNDIGMAKLGRQRLCQRRRGLRVVLTGSLPEPHSRSSGVPAAPIWDRPESPSVHSTQPRRSVSPWRSGATHWSTLESLPGVPVDVPAIA